MDTLLAQQLCQLRGHSGWTLDQLAQETGVSRATLARLEKAQVSPTTDTLAKLCRAYGTSMSRLLALVEDQAPAVIPATARKSWSDPKTGFQRSVVSPPSADLAGEWLDCRLPAGQRLSYDAPPRAGLEHHLLLLSGQLAVTVQGHAHHLNTGDCLRYRLYGATCFETSAEDAHYHLFLL
ncbi:helix-turn-helix domain-containing protein [Thalassovita mediterranea]|uniref:DNA-binding transcriptional repressor PuuR n=1 Tax=Thalassovita mediterranea TaxID=340021 RepID=A0A0P1GM90_9RHOB|nr:XRE family transcriptional regulator [Thalassovita mediterranea]CUH83536.1 DNA-binding transcriptional repressor PuuR [Thalassovita mediterranea]SIS34459.1 Helix-turn-helix domain-containing protein [Thalassovita mediterranea]